MEDEDFFEHFRNKDLSGIKKFNFKKAKALKSPEKALKTNICRESSVQSKSEVTATETKTEIFDFGFPFRSPRKFSSSNKTVSINDHDSLSKNKVSPEIPICNHISNVSTSKLLHSIQSTKSLSKKFTFKKNESGDVGITFPNKTDISSKEGRNDTILDSLYKSTISNKKDFTETEKVSEKGSSLKALSKKKEDFDVTQNSTAISGLSLSIKKMNSESKDLEESPSLLFGRTKLTSKGTFSVSKYFNNENKANGFKSNSLTPFKKLLQSEKCATKSDEIQNFNPDEKLDNCFSSDTVWSSNTILEHSKPITISDSSSTTTDSPILRPKKFVFKKIPLSSSSCITLSQQKSSLGDVFGEKKKAGELSITSSNDFLLEETEGGTNILNLRLSATRSEKSDNDDNFLHNKSINSKDCQFQTNEKESKTRNSPNVEKIHDRFLMRQAVSSSESLEITNDDYMDDEEFERRFGRLADQFDDCVSNSKEKSIVSTRIPAESETNTSKQIEVHNTEELLNEISNINWDDNCFEDEPIKEGFKDRGDDSEEFKGNYDHSKVLLEMLHQKFGLRSFRPHQREVINASLVHYDCFVLMPTGGGKSLCYQLPAILMPGVTVVISPLRALISDQVDKLNALDITAAHLCSDVSKAECEQIYMKLSMREPVIKLLYLTPEKISASRVIIGILDSLYQRGKLARFVIDEVHCLSQWGHDFRPDYKELSMLRKNYKDVPIICLTATATKQVEQDVINILGLKKVKRFIRSFNRPNIKYQVIPKYGKSAIEEIANLINSKFQNKSGIVYCLGRKDCDNLAEKFNALGIKSKPYHAGMNDKVRDVIQREWMQDRFHVIVATIAFGMGIDKPDVRFVIHNSVPKSVEAFYQESGRAGRDGEVSYSYLFYSYGDVGKLQRLMQSDRNMNKKTFDAHKENLKQMVSFAENLVDCRRHLQLIHLGEHFDRRICMRNKATICDNCENIDKYKTVDVTKEAKELCAIVKDLTASENVTMLHVADIYRGAKIKKILDRGHNKHPQYGGGATMDKNDIQRVLKELILKHILNDFCTYTGEFPVVYIQTGSKFYQFFNSDCKLHISVCTDKQRKREMIKGDAIGKERNFGHINDGANTSKSPASEIVRHTVQKQTTAKLQATRKLQLTQLKVQCHEQLLEECRRLAMERNLTLSSIMNLSAIKSMSEVLPNSKEEMLKIQHVTNANYNKYGEFFLKITQIFREKHDALVPLTVVSRPNTEKMGINSDDEYQSDFYPSGSQNWNSGSTNRGVKRKSSWGSKKRVYKKKRWFKKKKGKSSPKAKRTTSSGWKGKAGKGGGGLGLMPLHIK